MIPLIKNYNQENNWHSPLTKGKGAAKGRNPKKRLIHCISNAAIGSGTLRQ
jgi:hypothetical protein